MHGQQETLPHYAWSARNATALRMISKKHYRITHDQQETLPHYAWSARNTTALLMVSKKHYHIMHGQQETLPHYAWSARNTTTLCMVSKKNYHITHGQNMITDWKGMSRKHSRYVLHQLHIKLKLGRWCKTLHAFQWKQAGTWPHDRSYIIRWGEGYYCIPCKSMQLRYCQYR